VKPGEPMAVIMDFELPAEDGRYQVMLSPCAKACAVLRPRLATPPGGVRRKDGVVKLDRVRVTTNATLRANGSCAPWPGLYLPRADHLAKPRPDSRHGAARHSGALTAARSAARSWTLINPLLLMLTYFFVFWSSAALSFRRDQSRSGFALYFLAGMLPLVAFSEAAAGLRG